MDNRVELIGYYGSDLTHACSAWTSTSRDLTEDKLSRVGKLLTMLATEGHHTPFEKSSLHFLVTTDIATHIQLIKHRIGVSVNAESARYKELKEDKAYIPTDWPDDLKAELADFQRAAFDKYHKVLKTLKERGFSAKRAKESARFFLPYSNQITSDVMFNWRSFSHFVGLRLDDNAQLEVREVAKEMLRLAKATGQFDLTIKAFDLEKLL